MSEKQAQALKSKRIVKRFIVVLIIAALAACRGEPTPRDYQNAPPAMTHPADSSAQTPAAHGMGQPAPEPSSGVEGTSAPNTQTDPNPKTTTMPDTPPVTTTTTATTTT